jgi:hypothetical protein
MLPLYTGLLFLVLLVAGHMSGFTRNWFQVGSQLGQSLRLRKETRYALTLDRWFTMEAERRGRIEDLWEDYQFVVRKLGFSRLKLTLPDGTSRVWQAEGFDPGQVENFHAEHEMSDGTVVELSAASHAMPEVLFVLFGDLAAETWYKAAQRCRAANPKPASAANEPDDTDVPGSPLPVLAPSPPDPLIGQSLYT